MKKILTVFLLSFFFSLTASSTKAFAYDLFVKSDSASLIEDGTQENPYKTISKALLSAKEKNSFQSIFVYNGTYKEGLEIESPVSITGENKSLTIIDGDGNSNTIDIEKDTDLKNLTIYKGHIGIYISSGAKTNINSCRIIKTKKTAIEIEGSSTSDSEEVTIKDSDIEDNDGKGFYIKKRRIDIENNEINNNKEEGIDIRSGVKGKIRKNTISKSGESGIELILAKSNLKITSNKIKSNSANGISNQFYKESKKTGDVSIEKNKIQKNDDYGIQCATPSGGDVPENYWKKSIGLKDNIFTSNRKDIAGRCDIEITKKK